MHTRIIKPNRLLAFLWIFLLMAFLTACSNSKKTTIPKTQLKDLPGYVLNDTNFSRKDFNVWVVTTEPSFDSLFTKTAAADSKPNFDNDMVAAIKAQTSNYSYKTNFNGMVIDGRNLNVYFNVTKEKPDAENTGWVGIQTFPRDKQILRVKFYFDNVLVRTIPVVIVY